jgi:hypothetical protein
VNHTALAAGEARTAARIARTAERTARRGAEAGHKSDEAGVTHQDDARDPASGCPAAGRIYRHSLADKVGQMFRKIFKTAFPVHMHTPFRLMMYIMSLHEVL